MKKKKISFNMTKKKFKIKPLFDDSDMYITKKTDDDISTEQLDKEIDELVRSIKKKGKKNE